MACAGGQQGGTAIAELVSGAQAPSGRMSLSVPRNAGAMPYFYNHKLKSAGTPVALHFGSRYPFGHGLSTTRFELGGLAVAQTQVDIDGEIEIACELANVGVRAGVEVLQLYVRDRLASVVRPVRELKAFRRVPLAAGERVCVRFSVPVDMLCFTDPSGRRVVEPGWFDLMLGTSSANTPLRAAVQVGGSAPRRLPRDWRMESRSEVTLLSSTHG